MQEPTGQFVDVTENWGFLDCEAGRGLGVVAGSFDSRPDLMSTLPTICLQITSGPRMDRGDLLRAQRSTGLRLIFVHLPRALWA